LVGCGRIRAGVDVRIVDPERAVEVAAGHVGEIWVASPSVAPGYWRQPTATQATFQATLVDRDAGPFLRTGDLGFIQDNELYITGRRKDLIIIRGRNHYPQDIEATVAASHVALQAGGGAAFTAEVAGVERLVVVQEVARAYLRHLNLAEIVKAIRTAVAQEHDLQVQAIYLLRPLSIPKTSSGKIQRHLCRQKLLTHELEIVEEWTVLPVIKSFRTEEIREREAVEPWPSINLSLATLSAP
jgi:acyl-CoA synthetase (AMP-forming)/AMP-acid ligase II